MILDFLFGCRHKRFSFPLTPTRKTRRRVVITSNTIEQSGCYVVCLDCGKEFAYDWNEMRIVTSRQQKIFVPEREITAERNQS